MLHEWSRAQKDRWRPFRMPSAPVKRSIWLPGANALCVRRAARLGRLEGAEDVMLVERRPEIKIRMEKALRRVVIPNRNLFLGDLEDTEPRHIDFADLDLQGNITKPLEKWLAYRLSPALVPGATVVFTVTTKYRGNVSIKEQTEFLKSGWGQYLDILFGGMTDTVRRTMAIICRALRDWDFMIQRHGLKTLTIPTYRDSMSEMVILRLVQFRRKADNEEKFPPL